MHSTYIELEILIQCGCFFHVFLYVALHILRNRSNCEPYSHYYFKKDIRRILWTLETIGKEFSTLDNFDVLSLGKSKCIEPYVYLNTPPEPEILGIYNLDRGCELLEKHNTEQSLVVVHSDIDTDGICCTYEYFKYSKWLNNRKTTCPTINKDRRHGINLEGVQKINAVKPQLVIIVDSSSNEIECLKEFECDVLVIDHHHVTVDKADLQGKTKNGEYVVVTNMIDKSYLDNDTEHMSGAMVVYAVLKEHNKRYMVGTTFANLLLEQWVGISLFSDVIPTHNPRNQYFINRLLSDKTLESNLNEIMKSLSIWVLDKGTINFKIAPYINSTIRAGQSNLALETVLRKPQAFKDLAQFRDAQAAIIADQQECSYIKETYVLKDLTHTEIGRGYAGLIASKIGDINGRCAFVYVVEDGLCVGSFRGALGNVDYRKRFEDCGCFAAGHKGAFGLRIPKADLDAVMSKCCKVDYVDDYFISFGYYHGGVHHIENVADFKKAGNLVKLAILNARSTGKDELNIIYSGPLPDPIEKGKVFIYDINGLECIAFEPLALDSPIVLYAEFGTEVKIFARTKKVVHS